MKRPDSNRLGAGAPLSSGALRVALASFFGLTACAQILGLDELRDRLADSSDSSGDAFVPEAGPDAAPACRSNRECIDEAQGAPALCVRGDCVPIDTQVCVSPILPSNKILESDDAILFAAFLPVRGQNPLTTPVGLAYTLAIKELESAGGLPGPRPVGLLLCGNEADIAERAIEHVTTELRLPAMIAGFDGTRLTTVVQDAVRKEIFTLNPSVTPETLKYLDVKQLVWSLLGTAEDVARAYRPLLQRTELYVRSRRTPETENDPLKVALLVTNTLTEEAIATVLVDGTFDPLNASRDASKALAFNDGKSAAQNEAAGHFLRIAVPAEENGETPDYPSLVTELRSFQPDVVIALTRGEAGRIAEAMENGGGPRPVWLLGPRNATEDTVLGYLQSTTDSQFNEKRNRFLGVQYAGTTNPEQRNAWLQRMKAAFPREDPNVYAAQENYYDAVYWLAYGLAAAGNGAPVNGASIRDGVRKMLSGPRVVPGPPEALAAAFLAINVGGGVTFEGALGPPDVDTQFGTWNSVGAVYCYTDGDPSLRIAPHVRYDALRYDRTTGNLTGTFDCFLGF